jgi:glutamine amidotransferase
MQLLFDVSEEDGVYQGLGLLPGRVVRFESRPGLKIPHMGWNTLRIRRELPLFRGLPDSPSVYFVHSYRASDTLESDVAAESDHPEPFPAVVARDNLIGAQFHPEKSQKIGLALYANFARLG